MKYIRNYFELVPILILFSTIYYYIAYNCVNDIYSHAQIAINMFENGRLLKDNFLLYLLVNVFSLFCCNIDTCVVVLCILLGAAISWRYYLYKEEFHKYSNLLCSRVLSLSLLVVHVIPITYFFYNLGLTNIGYFAAGYLKPTVWHNSTILFLMPIAFITYNKTISLLKQEKIIPKDISTLSLWVILGVLVKPSFFFVYSVAFFIISLFRFKFTYNLLFCMLPLLGGTITLGYEYYTIYSLATDGSSVVFGLNGIFTNYFLHAHLYKEIIPSFILPFSFLLFKFKYCIKDLEFWFLVIMILVGMIIFYCIQETGPREGHDNFTWQVIPVMSLIYFYILRNLLAHRHMLFQDKLKQKVVQLHSSSVNNFSFYFCMTIYGLCVLMGLFYLFLIFSTKETFGL